MEWITVVDDSCVIDDAMFDNVSSIANRVAAADQAHRAGLRHVLERLYLSQGAVNISADKLALAKIYLSVAERIVVNLLRGWRTRYGAAAFIEGRRSRYRCSKCSFPDVRVLHCDHVQRENPMTPVACMCANCHNIKSREVDWTGKMSVAGKDIK
jgi:hypothetical protein